MRVRFQVGRLAVGMAAAAVVLAGSARADITIGLVTSVTGPVAAVGAPYVKGVAAGQAYQGEVGGEKIKVIVLDDASDAASAAKNARKLIEEDKVDVVIGAAASPACAAVAAVAGELKTPSLSPSPLPPGTPKFDDKLWAVTMPQKPTDMMGVVVEEMQRQGIKNIGFIGFSDAWGDLVYNNSKVTADKLGIPMSSNERYGRADTTVSGQILKVLAAKPDAVMDGGSGTGAALPVTALAERGFKGGVYGTPAVIAPEFVKLAGPAGEGLIASAGPILVVEQLPDSAPTKKIGLAFREAYKKANGADVTDGFAPYAFDAYLVVLDAAKRALATGVKPGTPEFRAALRDAIHSTKELVGTEGVYNFTADSVVGADRRGLVLVKLTGGKWMLYKAAL